MTFKGKLAGYCAWFSSSSYLPRLPVHSVTLTAASWKHIFALSATALMFSRAVFQLQWGTGGEESHNHLTLLGPCSVPQAGGVGTGDRELSFIFPYETPTGFISHYTVALKKQAAHANLLLWGYSSKRGCYINAFIFMRKHAVWKDLF